MTNTEQFGNARSSKLVFYVIQQECEDVLLSAESVKKHAPDVDVMLVSPRRQITFLVENDMIDEAMIVPEHGSSNWRLASTFYTMTALNTIFTLGYKKLIYMDYQTRVCAPIEDIFDMLDYFEFMGVHAPDRYSANTVHDIPDAFPEIALGMNPMRNTNSVRLMWSDMYEWFTAHEEVYGHNVQGVLRDILWKYAWCDGGPRLYVLPPEYGLKLGYQYFVNGEVKVIHGNDADCRKVKGLRLIND